jgi:hypothetical protein
LLFAQQVLVCEFLGDLFRQVIASFRPYSNTFNAAMTLAGNLRASVAAEYPSSVTKGITVTVHLIVRRISAAGADSSALSP